MANIKFSAFTQKVALGDVDFLVGYTGADNVRVAPSVFSGVYLPLAGGTMTGSTNHGDNIKSIYGTGGDFEIYHSGSTSYIADVGSGDLKVLFSNDFIIEAINGETCATFTENGAVDLYYDNTLMVSTVSEGINLPSNNVLFLDNTNDNNPVYFRNAGGSLATLQIGRGTTPGSNVSMTIDNSGQVGIGVVPTVGLQLGNSVAGETKLAIFNSEGGGEVGLTIQSRTNRAKLRVADNDTSAYVVAEGGISSFGPSADADTTNISVVAGNVGIGTVSPNALLEVSGGKVIIADGTTSAQTEDYLYIGGDGLASTDAAIYIGNQGAGGGYGWRLFYEGTGSGIDNKFIIKSENGGATVDALGFTTDGNATFAGNVELGDDQQVQLGDLTGGDLKLYYVGGTGGYVLNKTDDLRIINQANDKDILFETDDGTGSTVEYFRLDGSAAAVPARYTSWPTDSYITFGDNKDFELFWSTNGVVRNQTGDLYIDNSADDKSIIFRCDDNSGGITEYFRVDGLNAINQFSKETFMLDNVKLRFGTGGDLNIYHDASNSYIVDTGTGSLKVGAANWHLMDSALAAYMMTATPGAEVNLYYNGSGRFITTSDGVKVTGQYNVAALNTAPASAGAAGTLGEIRYTADYIYVCTATNTWKRTALSTW